MSRHLKNIVMNRLKGCGCIFEPLPSGTHHSRGVRYFRFHTAIKMLLGAMDMEKEGQKRRKRIIVRPSRFRNGLHELYTYHFPKHWSAACVANRELIKEAQRQAHALEHDHSLAALDWHVRFLHHYYTVFKGGAKPEPGMKPYSRFYQYTFVLIYRQLKAQAQKAKEEATLLEADLQRLAQEISFSSVTSLRQHTPRHRVRFSPMSPLDLSFHLPTYG